jgi:hypothetical protein
MSARATDGDAAAQARHIAEVLRDRTDVVLAEELPEPIARLLTKLKEVGL